MFQSSLQKCKNNNEIMGNGETYSWSMISVIIQLNIQISVFGGEGQISQKIKIKVTGIYTYKISWRKEKWKFLKYFALYF